MPLVHKPSVGQDRADMNSVLLRVGSWLDDSIDLFQVRLDLPICMLLYEDYS